MQTMKTLVIFATALFCVQAIRLPISLSSASSASSEEINILLPAIGQPPVNLPGIGAINQQTLQAIKQQLIAQAIAAQGITWPDKIGVGNKQIVLVRNARQVASTNAATKVVSEAADRASPATEVPSLRKPSQL